MSSERRRCRWPLECGGGGSRRARAASAQVSHPSWLIRRAELLRPPKARPSSATTQRRRRCRCPPPASHTHNNAPPEETGHRGDPTGNSGPGASQQTIPHCRRRLHRRARLCEPYLARLLSRPSSLESGSHGGLRLSSRSTGRAGAELSLSGRTTARAGNLVGCWVTHHASA